MHTESKPTYRNNQIRYGRLLSKSTLVIAQACCELQTTWTIKGSTLDCTEILKNSIMQVFRKQNLVPNIYTVLQKYAHIGLKQKLLRSTTLDIITRLLDKAVFICVHVVGRFSNDFSEVRWLRIKSRVSASG